MAENSELQADPVEILAAMRKTLRLLVTTTVVLFIALGGVGYLGYSNANRSQDALCALRADLEKRVAGSVKFLLEHPEGVQDIPAATIKEGIENQRRTIEALGDLSC